jgi:hypothetical protein
VSIQWALPRIQGPTGTALLWIYRVLMGLTVVFVLGSLVFVGLDQFRNIPNDRSFGFQSATSLDDAVVVMAVTTDQAAKAGLRENDVITAINGAPLPKGATEFTVGARMGDIKGDQAILNIVAADGPHTATLTRQPNVWMTPVVPGFVVWGYVALNFVQTELPAVILLACSIALFVRRPHDPEAMLIAFAFLPICYFPDAAFWLNAFFHTDPQIFQLITQLGLPLALVAFAIMPDGRFTSLISYVPAAVYLVFVVFSLTAFWAPNAWRAPPITDLIFLVTIFVTSVAALGLRYLRTPDVHQRQQIKWAAIGAGVSCFGFLFGVPFSLIGTAGGVPGWTFVPVLFVEHVLSYAAMPLGLLAAMLGYKLYDAETAVSRSTAFAGLMVALLAIFIASENLISGLSSQLAGHALGPFAGGMAAALTAMAIKPVHTKFSEWADRSFRSHLFDLREQLPALVGDLRETSDSDTIAKAVVDRVRTGVRASVAVVLVGEDVAHADGVEPDHLQVWRAHWTPPTTNGLHSARKDPVLPLRIALAADGVGQIGWLLLGPRPDGSFYGRDERKALALIADPIARALSISTTRERRRDRGGGRRRQEPDRRIGALAGSDDVGGQGDLSPNSSIAAQADARHYPGRSRE